MTPTGDAYLVDGPTRAGVAYSRGVAMQKTMELNAAYRAGRASRDAEVAGMKRSIEEWKFVPDAHGGHMLSGTNDKWYPESFVKAAKLSVLEELGGRLAAGFPEEARSIVKKLKEEVRNT